MFNPLAFLDYPGTPKTSREEQEAMCRAPQHRRSHPNDNPPSGYQPKARRAKQKEVDPRSVEAHAEIARDLNEAVNDGAPRHQKVTTNPKKLRRLIRAHRKAQSDEG